MIEQFISKQFLAFLLTGGIAATINFGSRLLYSSWVSFSSAVILAYITGMITAFLLAKLFVFKDSQQSINRSVIFFTIVNVVAVLQTWIVSMGLAFYLLPSFGVHSFVHEISHAVGVVLPVFTSYIGHKRWSFQ